jgi:hypothetical protein
MNPVFANNGRSNQINVITKIEWQIEWQQTIFSKFSLVHMNVSHLI